MKRRRRPITLQQHCASIASMGGTMRAAVLPAKRRSEIARKAGLAGGAARAAKLSARRRKEIARKAARARWGNVRRPKNPAAVSLGKLGAKARNARLTAAERREIASKAGKAGGRGRGKK